MVPPIDVPTPIVPPMSVMVEDEDASKPADVPAVQETTDAPEVPAETNENPEPLDGSAQAELLASAQPEPSMTYEQALQCTIPTGKYRDMTIDAARRLDGNNKVIPTFLKGWYKTCRFRRQQQLSHDMKGSVIKSSKPSQSSKPDNSPRFS